MTTVKRKSKQLGQILIELGFSRFEEVGSGYGVLQYCKQHDILLP